MSLKHIAIGKMTGLKLYTYPNNKNAWKALIAAEYVGAKIEVPAFEMGKTNKSPEFLKLNPNGKVRYFKGTHMSWLISEQLRRICVRDRLKRSEVGGSAEIAHSRASKPPSIWILTWKSHGFVQTTVVAKGMAPVKFHVYPEGAHTRDAPGRRF